MLNPPRTNPPDARSDSLLLSDGGEPADSELESETKETQQPFAYF
jgi:hypothetical protein